MNDRRKTNRLAQETSPYLLQHARNPVDWYPWGPEALERARAEDKPIFLSVGYSACHWCHVMEHESFENEEIAELMNRLFVNIKVDREERPDIDEIYMAAVTALNGSGGWPMSVFLTPSLEPFFGTTYLPSQRRYGRPSFPDVLVGLAEAWQQQREQVLSQARELTAHINQRAQADLRGTLPDDVLERAVAELRQQLDPAWGGFGAAPKFPHSGDIRVLLRHHTRTGSGEALDAARLTLDRMAQGGIYDQLGGGFHRYSTDAQWRVPHFEKMLYDNALLIVAYTEAYLVTGEPLYERVARGCGRWVLSEMITDEGAFASAQDADSEGEEGRFFAWTPEQLVEVLGETRGRWAAAFYGVAPEGNFEEGKSVLWTPRPLREVAAELGIPREELAQALDDARRELKRSREKRVRPATDDKILAAWNGLMISGLCIAYQVFEDDDFVRAAERAAAFVLSQMRTPDGRLLATARGGRAQHNGYLEDYVFMTQALLDLYETNFDEGMLAEARSLCERVETHFVDEERGGYFTTADDHEQLIARMKSLHDGALPAATGVQTLNLLRLARFTGEASLERAAARAIESQAKVAGRHPRLFSHLLLAIDYQRAFDAGRGVEFVLSAQRGDPELAGLLRTLRRSFLPSRVVALATTDSDPQRLPLLAGRQPQEAGARAFVCRNFACAAPVDAAGFPRALREIITARVQKS